jgi:hypothetical protein
VAEDMQTEDSDAPLVAAGQTLGPKDSARLVALGGVAVQRCAELTGRDKFEHMVLYCLTLLDQGGGKLCAFYLEDFDDCDEHTLRVIQKLMRRAGYTTRDFLSEPRKEYQGFWVWKK